MIIFKNYWKMFNKKIRSAKKENKCQSKYKGVEFISINIYKLVMAKPVLSKYICQNFRFFT